MCQQKEVKRRLGITRALGSVTYTQRAVSLDSINFIRHKLDPQYEQLLQFNEQYLNQIYNKRRV